MSGKPGVRMTVQFVLDEPMIEPLQRVSDEQGLGSMSRAAKALVSSMLLGEDFGKAADREVRLKIVYEQRQWVVTRLSAYFDELKLELLKNLNEQALIQELGRDDL